MLVKGLQVGLEAVADRIAGRHGLDLQQRAIERVELIQRIARVLKRPIFKQAVYEVGGHTDECGADSFNLSLSERRADAGVGMTQIGDLEHGPALFCGALQAPHLVAADQAPA